MHYKEGIEIPLFQFDILKPYSSNVVHFVSTRNPDFLPSASNCFTIGLNGALENEFVLVNRKLIANSLGFKSDSYVFASQDHGKNVAVVTEKEKGRGAFSRTDYIDGVDALVTNNKGICLIAQAADCVPILFFDPIKKIIASAHAGWKGTVLKIVKVVVEKMKVEFCCNPQDILIGIGPSAGPCCYEVGNDVIIEVTSAFGQVNAILKVTSKPDRAIFNMWEANRINLLEAGVKEENIEISSRCTICENNTFFSARKGDKGRFAAGIMLV